MGQTDNSGLSRMSLYGASRGVRWLAVGSVLAAIVPATTHLGVNVPVIVGDGSSVITWSTFAPYLLALAFARALSGRRTHLSEYAVRRIGLRDAAVLLGVNLIVLGGTLTVPEGDLTVPRNTAFLTGLTSVVLGLASPSAASAALTGVTLAMVTYGRYAPWGDYIRVVQAPPSLPTALAAALGALTIGALCLVPDVGLSRSELWIRRFSPTRRTRR